MTQICCLRGKNKANLERWLARLLWMEGHPMFVRDFMTRQLITAKVDEGAGPVLQRMREEGLRRMPVVDDQGQLVGIITDRRLLRALGVPVRRGAHGRDVSDPPLPVVGELMNRQVLSTSPDALLEEAASVMAEFRIGSLVVVADGDPVGIITETDMFRVFLRLLLDDQPGFRVTVRAPAFRGILADISTGVARAGGNLLSLASLSDEEGLLISLKVADMTEQDLEDVLDELPVEAVDIRAI
jgi:acetoin utilization protein AcuB